MTGYTLTWQGGAPLPQDGSQLLPALAQLPPDELAQHVGPGFAVEGEPGERLTLRNLPPLDRYGANMAGGELIIEGDGGDHVALRMRRGIIVIKGKAGACPGYRMIAGTLAVTRGPYDHPGLEMRRGTIICLDHARPVTGNAAFAEEGVFLLPAMRLVIRHLQSMGVDAPGDARYRLFSGDRFELGKGELWQKVD